MKNDGYFIRNSSLKWRELGTKTGATATLGQDNIEEGSGSLSS